MSPGSEAPPALPARSLYAVVRSACAWAAVASVIWKTAGGVKTPGPASIAAKPVTDVPGLRQTSPPVITVRPVLVTVEPARMAQPAAAPSATAVPPAPPLVLSESPHDVMPIAMALAVRSAKNLTLLNTRMRIVSFSAARLPAVDLHVLLLETLPGRDRNAVWRLCHVQNCSKLHSFENAFSARGGLLAIGEQ